MEAPAEDKAGDLHAASHITNVSLTHVQGQLAKGPQPFQAQIRTWQAAQSKAMQDYKTLKESERVARQPLVHGLIVMES